MKKFLIIVFLFSVGIVFCQERVYEIKDVTVPPIYGDSANSFRKCIVNNLVIPDLKSGKYTVNLSFVVEKDGTLSEPKIDNPIREDFKDAPIKAFLRCSEGVKWAPGKLDGKEVRTRFVLQLVINIS